MSEEVKPVEPAAALAPVEPKPAEPVKPAEPKPAEAAKPEGEKPPEKAAEKPAAPEKYELKLAEGSIVDPSFVERIAAHAKAQGLSQEQAQALLDQQSQEVASYVEQQKKQWWDQSVSDKEIGGDALNKNVELAKRVVDRFGSESLKVELEKTGYGNHPEVVRMLKNIGATMSEDQFIVPGSQPSAVPKSREELYYGKADAK